MARLTPENSDLAQEILARYPRKKSALIPLLHLAQEQDGYVSDDAMEHIGELVDCTPAEVYGTCTFYEMFKRRPVGKYLVNICHGISCHVMGADQLVAHAEQNLGMQAGSTTDDGLFTLEEAECQAACTEAPCLQVNYRYRYKVSAEDFDRLITDLRAGRFDDEIPPHGTLARPGHRQHIPADRAVGPADPARNVVPVWIARHEQADAEASK